MALFSAAGLGPVELSDPRDRLACMRSSVSPAQVATARRVAADLDSLRPAIDAVNQVLVDNAAAIDAAIALGERRIRAQLSDTAEQISRALASADWGWRDQFAQASVAAGRIAQERIRALDRTDLAVDTAALSCLLSDLDTWRALTREQRDQALGAARIAYVTTAAEPADDVLPGDLAAAMRDITATDVDYLPIAVSRQTFRMFVGAVVLLSLMTLSFSNNTADGIMSKGTELSALALLAMQAADALWARRNGGQGTDQQDSHDN
ncbi:hypothetical protein ACIRQQ_38605 [Streptomyces fuscichromogenes]|uniref:hypothetical protein n=1 Tax=Streptomyces fuscichromogenes TaxID=1324013 RepID=UPI0037FA0D00